MVCSNIDGFLACTNIVGVLMMPRDVAALAHVLREELLRRLALPRARVVGVVQQLLALAAGGLDVRVEDVHLLEVVGVIVDHMHTY